MKKFGLIVFAFLCVAVGLYPVIYFLIDIRFGLLGNKTAELLESAYYMPVFYGHIIPGGLALLIGWSQFVQAWRKRWPSTHRTIGKIYLLAVLISGMCGLAIATQATGGIVPMIAFMASAIFWLVTSGLAYSSARKGDYIRHRNMMIYSYAVCFSAVTLRVWLPLLVVGFGEFVPAYRIVSWLSWVPNVIVAYFIVRRLTSSKTAATL